jgi:hypothetical protein
MVVFTHSSDWADQPWVCPCFGSLFSFLLQFLATSGFGASKLQILKLMRPQTSSPHTGRSTPRSDFAQNLISQALEKRVENWLRFASPQLEIV